MTISTSLPDWPLLCLRSASSKSTKNVFLGRPTVIDFWTTKCVRCPDALDKLDSLAQHPKFANVEFTSIVIDACDGARTIIEENHAERWSHINHYYMDKVFKEEAKSLLGFQQVPFYVILDENGDIVQKGGTKQVDFESIPGIVRQMEHVSIADREDEDRIVSDTARSVEPPARVFCMDEDF